MQDVGGEKSYDGRTLSSIYLRNKMYIVTPFGAIRVRYYEPSNPDAIEETLDEYTDVPSDPGSPEEKRVNEVNPKDGKNDSYIDWETGTLYWPMYDNRH